jgi:PAS domain S-box-containing protein
LRSVEPSDPALTYATVLDALPIVAFMARSDGSFSYVSRGWTEFTGVSAETVLGFGYQVVLDPADAGRIVRVWDEARRTGTAYRDEHRLRFGDGSYRWVLSQAAPLRDDAGRIVGWFGTLADIEDHRRVELAMRNQAEFNERLIDSSDDCIKILDLDAKLVSMSANGQRNLRIMDFATVAGKSWIEFWKNEDRTAAVAAVEDAKRGGTGRFTGYFPVEDEPRWFDVVVTPIMDALGRPERLLAVSRDVTAQRRTQEALAESEATYRAFSEAIPGVTWAASPSGELTHVGDQWITVHGKPRDGALGEAWLESVHPDDRERVLGIWARSLASGEIYDTEFRVRLADGTYHWFLVRALPVRDESGAIVRWVGVNIDIEERRRADEAREMFVALAENSSDFIGIADHDGNAVYVNEAGRRLLDLGSLEDARATNLMDYFRAEDHAAVHGTILPTIETEGRWVGDFRFRNFRTGEPVPVAYNLFRLLDKNGSSLGIATVSRDRRERERIETGLRLLSRTGAAVLDSLDYSATMRNIGRAFVDEFASYCIIDVIDPQRGWDRTVVHREPDLADVIASVPQPAGDHPIARALRRRESSVVAVDASWSDAIQGGEERGGVVDRLGVRSFITVPVVTPTGEVVGALTCALDATAVRERYGSEDLPFVEEVGRRAGAAIANARLYERERRIAVELQAASLPAALPRVAPLDLDAEYRPGSDEATIGGDWYDAFALDDGRVAITVGDVLGHGLHAAVTMTKLRQAMQAAAMMNPDPNVMLDVADKTLRLLDPDGYATALAVIYDPAAAAFTVASAGHPGPALRTSDGRIAEFSSPGLMLGLGDGVPRETVLVPAAPGSLVVFFTDGLVEATRDMDEGHRRLHAALGRADVVHGREPARAIVRHVLGGTEATDDIAVLVARIGRDA